ncbi:MAG: ABC transporter ATP-binding protein [Spirochaetes bacterium]|nr:ABC transporter ATP-binding protein [Spirochaetota bacterium]
MEEKKPVVEMRSIRKVFLDVIANRDIDFSLYRGEVCSLLGENGAGKTTLMNVLFGYYALDGGEIYIKGEKVNLSSPKDAIDKGIGMIHQHFTLVPSQSVLENIIIGAAVEKGLFLDFKSAGERVVRLGEEFGLLINPDVKVWTLSVGEQQKVEILKALYRDVDILIMDEPTAVLAPKEIIELFKTLKALVKRGKSVVFISHKLNEVMEISDRIVVLRNGGVTAERKTSETNIRELANLMVGRDILEKLDRKNMIPGKPVLEIENLSVLNEKGLKAVKDLNLVVHKNEIVGVAGVSGNGQTELSESLFGIREPVSGVVKVNGKKVKKGNPAAAIDMGMGRIPEDRIETGLLMDLSVEENIILENHLKHGFQKYGLMNFNRIHEFSDKLIKDYKIKTAGSDIAAKSLSGGNLQKVILARELSGQPSVVIASQPTRGLDVGAMEYIHERLLEERDRGAGIMLISEDLDEVFTLSDRIVVMYEGEIIGEAGSGTASKEQIGLWMSGVKK